MKRIAVLGSTGSIGTQTLEIVRTNKDIKITALAAGNNIELLEKQIREFKPSIAAVWNEEKAAELKIKTADLDVEILSGMDGLLAAASWKDSQIVVTAIVGMIGILPTIEAIKAGKDIALANKETLVTAGHIIMPLAEQYKVSILPVDSEHSAIFQSLQGGQRKALHKILLTASGGPFRGKKREELTGIQVEDALKHPNWEMGQKITIDSSTMVNKGLEVIEAKWLFDVSVDQIQVVVQPQSIIHSMVEYEDGAVIAQLGTPDMKLPIQYALYYPERRYLPGDRLDFSTLSQITFEKPDMETFYGLKLAYEAGRKGGSLPTVFNAANERAVAMFLGRQIAYLEIPEIISACMENHKNIADPTVIAQLGTPDMKLPIQYALYYPERRYLPGDRLDFSTLSQITFEKPDMETFYGLKLAYEAGRKGGSLPTVFNAANERAVAMFLGRQIAYLEIPEIISACMENHKNIADPTVEEILKTERETYEFIKNRW